MLPGVGLSRPQIGSTFEGHERAAIGTLNRWHTVGGRTMKMLTKEQLFAAPKLVSRAEERRARGIAAVSAARERATEIAEQSAAQPKMRPTVLHRRRLERLKGQLSP